MAGTFHFRPKPALNDAIINGFADYVLHRDVVFPEHLDEDKVLEAKAKFRAHLSRTATTSYAIDFFHGLMLSVTSNPKTEAFLKEQVQIRKRALWRLYDNYLPIDYLSHVCYEMPELVKQYMADLLDKYTKAAVEYYPKPVPVEKQEDFQEKFDVCKHILFMLGHIPWIIHESDYRPTKPKVTYLGVTPMDNTTNTGVQEADMATVEEAAAAAADQPARKGKKQRHKKQKKCRPTKDAAKAPLASRPASTTSVPTAAPLPETTHTKTSAPTIGGNKESSRKDRLAKVSTTTFAATSMPSPKRRCTKVLESTTILSKKSMPLVVSTSAPFPILALLRVPAPTMAFIPMPLSAAAPTYVPVFPAASTRVLSTTSGTMPLPLAMTLSTPARSPIVASMMFPELALARTSITAFAAVSKPWSQLASGPLLLNRATSAPLTVRQVTLPAVPVRQASQTNEQLRRSRSLPMLTTYTGLAPASSLRNVMSASQLQLEMSSSPIESSRIASKPAPVPTMAAPPMATPASVMTRASHSSVVSQTKSPSSDLARTVTIASGSLGLSGSLTRCSSALAASKQGMTSGSKPGALTNTLGCHILDFGGILHASRELQKTNDVQQSNKATKTNKGNKLAGWLGLMKAAVSSCWGSASLPKC